MASAEAPPAAVPVQTVVLRVSIHCQGCKKKVRKVLRSIEGVQNVAVDGAQHKVTVTGTVDADTLVRRLYKSGKQAAPWHPLAAVAPAPAAKNPEHAAPAAPEALAPAAPADDGGSKGVAAEDKVPEEQPVKEPQGEGSEKKPEQETAPEKTTEAEKETESEKKPAKEEAKPSDEAKKGGGESEAAAEPPKEAAKEAGNDEDEASKKKDKPKDAGEPVPAAAAGERSLPRSLPPVAAEKHAHEEHYPYYYPQQPQPVLSYHMAQPTASVSYYAGQPEPAYSVQQQPAAYSFQQPPPQPAYSGHEPQPQTMQQWSPSYLYMPYPHAAPESYYHHDHYSPPGTHSSPQPPAQPLHDSYRMFDDENPNACSVM